MPTFEQIESSRKGSGDSERLACSGPDDLASPGEGPSTVAQAVRGLCGRGDRGVFLRLLDPAGGSQDYSYSALVDRALCWSAHYAQRGLRPGSHLVVLLQHSVDLYAAYLGALLGGMVPAMFAFPSAKLPMAEYARTIGRLLDNAHPELIVTYPELKHQLTEILPHHQGALLVCPSPDLPGCGRADFWLGGSSEDTAFLQYSSGTTGLKKGVAISHRALFWHIQTYRKMIEADERDRIISWLPLYHDMGLICCYFLPLLTGIPLVTMSPFDWVKRPAMLLEAISEHRGTLCWLPNFAYNCLAQNVSEQVVRTLDLASLRGVVNCSEPVIAGSHERFLARFACCGLKPGSLAASYAMAETTFAVTSGGFGEKLKYETISAGELSSSARAVPVPATDADARTMVSSGIALPETAIRILNEKGGSLPERRVGEISVRSPSLMRGYHLNPDATTKALCNGELLTGDLGYLADGHLFVTGRKKDLIIIAGKNLYPQDIEYAVSEVDGVIPGRVVALGIPDPAQGTEQLVVVAETTERDAGRIAALSRSIFDRVAAQSEVVPSDIRLVEHMWLLKSSSGKISRGANRERYLELIKQGSAGQPSGDASETPTSEVASGPSGLADLELRERVTESVRRVLRRKERVLPPDFRADTPLIRGGLIDSLSIVTLVMELESALGVGIPQAYMETRNFDSVANILQIVRALTQPGSGLPPSRATALAVTKQHGGPAGHGAGYEAYVSLGYDCEAGLQLKRIGYEETGFFSYGCAPLECILKLLENDFADVFLKENLQPFSDGQVRDTKYGISLHSDLRSAVDPASGQRRFLDDYDFDRVYRLFYSLTIRHLVDKWRTLLTSERPVLYILKLKSGSGREHAKQMRRFFTRKYPNHPATILSLQTEDHREEDWGVAGLINRYLPRFAPSGNAHDGDLQAWDQIFAEFPLRANPPIASLNSHHQPTLPAQPPPSTQLNKRSHPGTLDLDHWTELRWCAPQAPCTNGVGRRDGDLRALLVRASNACERGDLTALSHLFAAARKFRPDSWDDGLALGHLALNLGQPLPALEYFTVAVKLDPNQSLAHASRALAMQLLNRSEEAGEDAERALRLNPNDSVALKVLARISLNAKRPDKARTCCLKVLAGMPDDVDAKLMLQECEVSR